MAVVRYLSIWMPLIAKPEDTVSLLAQKWRKVCMNGDNTPPRYSRATYVAEFRRGGAVGQVGRARRI